MSLHELSEIMFHPDVLKTAAIIFGVQMHKGKAHKGLKLSGVSFDKLYQLIASI